MTLKRMTPEEIAAQEAAAAAVKKEEEAKAAQDALLQKELEKVNARGEGHTRREKLVFTQKKIEQQLAELDRQEGVEPTVDEENDDAPVTVGMLKKLESQKATKTALQLADDIEDSSEKELVRHHLQNTIRSTGNPSEDIRLARALVNSAKNSQIAEELARKTSDKSAGGGSGAPANREITFEPTADEAAFMRPPFNMTKEDVLKARIKS